MLRLMGASELAVPDVKVSPEALAGLIALVDGGKLSSSAAKEVFAVLFESGGDPAEIMRQKGLAQVSDSGELDRLADRAMAENPKSVEDYRRGKAAAAKFLVGQVMRLSRGKANPQMAAEIIERKLSVS